MTQIIEVIVSPTGETKIETKGFTGSSCRDASRFIEEALGQRMGEQLTAEFHAASDVHSIAAESKPMNTTNFTHALAKIAGQLWSRPVSAPAVRQLPVLVIVEGRHDIEFLKRVSGMLAAHRAELPNLSQLEQTGKLVFIPAGGDFVPWLHRLAGFGCAEVHIYDREIPPVTQQRQAGAAAVNRRPRCCAFVTQYRALENYLHTDAIREDRGLDIVFSDQDDVAALAAQASLALHSSVGWDSLSRRARQRLRNRAKAWLNTAAAERMTPQRIAERDPAGEIPLWLATIGRFAGKP